jgi:two-component system nitrate/nitrite sensor histidine kinase NarX
MTPRKQWSLGAKLALVASPFLALALLSIALTLWVSWQLEGGAAAVNEAGRMRMQAYRMALSVGTAQPGRLPEQVSEFDRSLALLRQGDPERPLFVPWDDDVRGHFASVERDWAGFQARWIRGQRDGRRRGPEPRHGRLRGPCGCTGAQHRDPHVALDGPAASGTAGHDGAGRHRHVGPGLHRLPVCAGAGGHAEAGDPSACRKATSRRAWSASARDEFGTLAEGFNGMAGHVQSMYQHLECRVAEKTAELQEKRERLEALYSVTSLVGSAATLQDLARASCSACAPWPARMVRRCAGPTSRTSAT